MEISKAPQDAARPPPLRLAIAELARVAGAAGLLAFAACHRSEPVMSEAKLDQIRVADPGITEACLTKLRYGGLSALPETTDQCFRMMPAQRWRGLWRNDFEGSRFCPEPAQSCFDRSPGSNIWLTFGKSDPPTKREPGALYSIDFIGRRTAMAGGYGHGGGSDHEVIVDQLRSIRLIETPRAPDDQ